MFPLGHGGLGGGLGLEALGLGPGRQAVLGGGEGRQRRLRVLERPAGDPGLHRRLELRAEPLAVEVGQHGLVARVGVHPLGEGGDVDLGLAVGKVRPAGRLHPGGVGPAERLGLLAGPAAGLVAAPGDGQRGHRQQDGRGDLDPGAPPAAAVPCPGRRGAHAGRPSASQGSGSSWPSAPRAWSMSTRVCLHGDRSQLAQAWPVGLVQDPDQQQGRDDDGDDRAHQQALGDRPLPAVGEEQHVDHDDRGDEEQDPPQRRRDDALGGVDAVAPGLLARGGQVEPLVVGGLLGRGRRLDGLHGPEQGQGPGVDGTGLGAGLHPRPLLADDRPSVADQLPAEPLAGGGRQELGRLELLDHGQGLGLGPRLGVVVAGEGEEHDEPEQEGEPGGEHPEHPGGAVAVAEVATLRGAPADQQHGGDGHRHRRRDDQPRQEEVHAGQAAPGRPGAHHLHGVIRVRPGAGDG